MTSLTLYRCATAPPFVLRANNNEWQWSVWMVAAYRQTYSSGWLSQSVGWHLPLCSSDEPGQISQWLCHDDSSINVGMDIGYLLLLLFLTARILSLDNNHVTGEAWNLLMKDDCPYVLFVDHFVFVK